MTEYLLRERKIERHKEYGPIDSMEAENILTDNVNVAGPVLLKVFALLLVGFVRIVSERGDIVAKCVYPNVDNVLIVKIHGNTPLKRGTGNAKVLKPCLKEVVYHFLFSGFGRDKVGVAFDMIDKTLCILVHIEEVRLLTRSLHGTSAVGALAVNSLRVGKEGLTGSAVPALVFALVDIAVLIELCKYLFNSFLVVFVGGADEIIVACVHSVPDLFDLARDTVNVLLGSDVCRSGKIFYLLSVLVGTGAEENVISHSSFVSCDSVGGNNLVGVTEVRLLGSVCNSCGYIIILFVVHFYTFLKIISPMLG